MKIFAPPEHELNRNNIKLLFPGASIETKKVIKNGTFIGKNYTIKNYDEKEARQREFQKKMSSLKNHMLRWSEKRCSSIAHNPEADKAEIHIMTQAHQITSKENIDSLKHVFESQKSVCGTSEQYKHIYNWVNKAMKDY
jgi:seryl-tRNA(Sec) selenium transferase